MKLTLSGDENNFDMPMTDSQVNHLRRLLAWMRCEYMLDDDMQQGVVKGATQLVASGLVSPEDASEMLQKKAEEISQVPAYVRQAVKMLTKAIQAHDARTGVIEA